MELRAYFFQNMYLSLIQAGIQSQHTTAEMFMKYLPSNYGDTTYPDFDYKSYDDKSDMLYDWASNHKTTIVLNGGMAGDLYKLLHLLEEDDNPYPFAFFKEAEYSLDGALTNVGIIIPERVYNNQELHLQACANGDLDSFKWTLTEWEARFVEVLSSKRLMR